VTTLAVIFSKTPGVNEQAPRNLYLEIFQMDSSAIMEYLKNNSVDSVLSILRNNLILLRKFMIIGHIAYI
jgi:hypothetical protein